MYLYVLRENEMILLFNIIYIINITTHIITIWLMIVYLSDK